MSKQGIMHCFINYKLVKHEREKTITKESTFHFSGNASKEKEILSIGAVCSGLLQQIGIEHDVNYCYKPMYDKNYCWMETVKEEGAEV